mmetsp:Transcript_3593/g.12702  ORF Transcript_3593/g.12702 Transcript_3593/m.12702 type:complete len:81 (+) Transcript_3593:2199-2441(+)
MHACDVLLSPSHSPSPIFPRAPVCQISHKSLSCSLSLSLQAVSLYLHRLLAGGHTAVHTRGFSRRHAAAVLLIRGESNLT